MKIAVIGTGYVGLVSSACFAAIGHEVVGIDKLPEKIEILNNGGIPIYEPGLAELVAENKAAGRLSFTLNMAEGIKDADAVFIAVGTPPHPETGHADMKYVHAATKEVAEHMDGFTVIVNKSTVPVGTGDEVDVIIREVAPSKDFSVVSNPEFLREGAAINDFLKPDRIIIGTECEKSQNIIRQLYLPITDAGYPIHCTSRKSAELIKYASNAFLATKISFINEMADLCEKVGGDIEEVSTGMGLDSRIGSRFLQAGPGYGGSCFPKDTLALVKTGEDHDVPMQLVRTTVKVNEERKVAMAHKIIKACDGTVSGKTVGILGLTFKANTDDMRDASSLVIIPELIKAGAIINAYDPEGMKEAQHHFKVTINYCDDINTAIQGVDIIIILTEWEEFKYYQYPQNNTPILDMRNLIKDVNISGHHIQYLGS